MSLPEVSLEPPAPPPETTLVSGVVVTSAAPATEHVAEAPQKIETAKPEEHPEPKRHTAFGLLSSVAFKMRWD